MLMMSYQRIFLAIKEKNWFPPALRLGYFCIPSGIRRWKFGRAVKESAEDVVNGKRGYLYFH